MLGLQNLDSVFSPGMHHEHREGKDPQNHLPAVSPLPFAFRRLLLWCCMPGTIFKAVLLKMY